MSMLERENPARQRHEAEANQDDDHASEDDDKEARIDQGCFGLASEKDNEDGDQGRRGKPFLAQDHSQEKQKEEERERIENRRHELIQGAGGGESGAEERAQVKRGRASTADRSGPRRPRSRGGQASRRLRRSAPIRTSRPTTGSRNWPARTRVQETRASGQRRRTKGSIAR